jgi:hypothetical protein
MPKFMLRETLYQYYMIDADTEDSAIARLYDGEGSIDPINAEYLDNILVKEIKDADIHN